ncbi:hypothetical protein BO78DRAFT_267498, partial [Aspergillus sclerotiicarbonarius CBS 121057]
GFIGGAGSGSRCITTDPEGRQRIKTAFRKFRAEVLREDADQLDRGLDVSDQM